MLALLHSMREDEGKTDKLVKSGASLTCTVTWDEMFGCVRYVHTVRIGLGFSLYKAYCKAEV